MKKFLSSIGVLTLVLGVSGLSVVETAGAASKPVVTITPNSGLVSNQKVVITGTGFTAGESLAAVECVATATTSAGCALGGLVLLTVNPDGTLPSTNFYVQTGTIGNGTCGTSAADATCAIAIGTTTGTLVTDATITFASTTTGP